MCLLRASNVQNCTSFIKAIAGRASQTIGLPNPQSHDTADCSSLPFPQIFPVKRVLLPSLFQILSHQHLPSQPVSMGTAGMAGFFFPCGHLDLCYEDFRQGTLKCSSKPPKSQKACSSGPCLLKRLPLFINNFQTKPIGKTQNQIQMTKHCLFCTNR